MWSLWLVEFRYYPSEKDRRGVVRRWEARAGPPSIQLLAGFFIGLAAFLFLPIFVFRNHLGPWSAVWAPLGTVLGGFCLRWWHFGLRSNPFRNFIRNDLLLRRICWQCGYDLSGNETGQCSECGLYGVQAPLSDERIDAG